MSQTDITVVLTVYNQDLSSIETSMNSIAAQIDCSYQLIVADDHSSQNMEEKVTRLASSLEIERFSYIRHPENVQTVRNILFALPFAEGRYTKAMGSGDELYDNHVLADIVEFCDVNDVEAGFGGITLDTANGPLYDAPKKASAYNLESVCSGTDQLHLQLLNADWIPAGCQFFKTEKLASLLSELSSSFHIRYCEDFAQTICLPDTKPIHMNRPVVVYEWGTGVSNRGSRSSRKRLYADHNSLYRTFSERYPDDEIIAKSYRIFKLREFAALKTPLYPLLQKLSLRSYTRDQNR